MSDAIETLGAYLGTSGSHHIRETEAAREALGRIQAVVTAARSVAVVNVADLPHSQGVALEQLRSALASLTQETPAQEERTP